MARSRTGQTSMTFASQQPGAFSMLGFLYSGDHPMYFYDYMQNAGQWPYAMYYGNRIKQIGGAGTSLFSLRMTSTSNTSNQWMNFFSVVANYLENNATSLRSPFQYEQLESNSPNFNRTCVFGNHVTGKSPGINFTDVTFTGKTVTNNFSS
jgi:hypothetical protein